MINKLAEEIYEKSLMLKRIGTDDLLLKSKRIQAIDILSDIKSLVSSLLLELKDNTSFSDEYFRLALLMYESVFESVVILSKKEKDYKMTAIKYIHGFHNLPRAFMSAENRLRISAGDAMNYYSQYIK